MNPTPEQWNEAVEKLFSDEDKLVRKLREMKSIDEEAAFAFVDWTIKNGWHLPDIDGDYINEVTGEVVDGKELRRRYKNKSNNNNG